MEYRNVREIFPGIGCARANAAGKMTAEYYGVADRESNAPVTRDTVFPACSVSKFITAICVMKLYEQGAMDIDHPVNHYLRQWKLRTSDGSESDASIRSVLCHTAGIVDGEDAFYGLRRNDPEISLMDILEGKTAYNNRPVRAEKPQGETFEYSDAGYCVLQQLLQEVMHQSFDGIVRDTLFHPLGLGSTFFAAPGNITRFENRMATGYDDAGLPIPGRFPSVPDLAASGLWSTPEELLSIAREFLKAYDGRSGFLRKETVREIVKPVEKFPWTGLGLFIGENDTLVSRGWGENGQCILKMHCLTGETAVVMTNRNPGVDQQASGVEWLADRRPDEGNQVSFGTPGDIGSWMNLVRQVRWNFPGLEKEEDLEEHRQTVLKYMGKKQALCTKNGEEITGVLLFSRNRNMICCLAVSPEQRKKGIASKLLEKALDELDRSRDITVSTFREEDEKGIAPRALYRKYGFREGDLTEEFGYPNQVFVLKSSPDSFNIL
ncbi:MAG: GNAT family N-acetyltransferase [Clostridia bacterium]|nr:GNAT family N-acetyltransferase [Clostridia bacterium]